MADITEPELIFEEEIEEISDVAEETRPVFRGGYTSIHSSGFRDFLLKPELLRAINDGGFEHPSEGN